MDTKDDPTPEQRCARARELLAAGDARAAFAEIRSVLAYPAAPEGALLRDALDALAAIASAIAGQELGDRIAWARDRTDDGEALYDAAYALYEQHLHDLAAALLARANRLSPGSPTIVSELSANLEALLLHGHAAALLRESGLVETDPVCGYLYGYNALMSGDVEAARPIAARLRGHEDTSLAYMGGALAGMVARADAVRGAATLDDRDLAGWHWVVNGSVLLHLSPDGFEDAMRGRYAYVSDGYERLREGLDRLALVLAAAGITAPRVVALPDRGSRIVARAAATLLGLPCEDWPAGGDDRPALVIAYDLDRVEDADALERMREHRPGQVLFAHASSWTDPFPYAPDVTTYLYQVNVAPWDAGRMRYDSASGKIEQQPADEAPIEEIAARIVAASVERASVSTPEQLRALVTAARATPESAAGGLFRAAGQRLRQRAGSPVRSNRFT
jgi:hypothetical protein